MNNNRTFKISLYIYSFYFTQLLCTSLVNKISHKNAIIYFYKFFYLIFMIYYPSSFYHYQVNIFLKHIGLRKDVSDNDETYDAQIYDS